MKNPRQISTDDKQKTRQTRPAWMYFVLGGAIGLAVIICLTSLAILIFPQARAQLVRLLTPAPPTPPCVNANLSIGSTSFRIETLKPKPDGSLSVPLDPASTAYWVESSATGYVFALSPAAENMVLLAGIKEGDPITITWGDCSVEIFTVQAKEIGQPELVDLLSASGATIFTADSATGSAIVLRSGVLPVAPGESSSTEEVGIQAEISFLDTTTAVDGSTITMSIEITNTGAEPIDLTAADISLTPEGATPLAPLSVEPALPQQIQPGASLSLQITFPKPGGSTAVFRILDFSLDQYY